MKLLIDIPEESYKATCNQCMLPPDVKNVVQGIKNGTPLPKGHGRLKDIDKIEQLLDLDKPNNMIAKSLKNLIDSVPTIIEADTGE